MDGFLGICHTSLGHQVHYSVGEHLRVNAQILMILQRIQYGVWDISNACKIKEIMSKSELLSLADFFLASLVISTHLQCSTVIDQILRNQLSDFRLLVGWRFATV